VTESKSQQKNKSCQQCGFGNSLVAKFCIECGERFVVSSGVDTALESDTISSTRTLETSPPAADPRSEIEKLLASLTPEQSSTHLARAIAKNRVQLKASGTAIPKATNPIMISLMESLKSLPSNEISARTAIVTALGRMGDPATLPPLLLVSKAQSKEVRQAVAIALGSVRHPLSAYLLIPMLQDGSSRVRQASFQALIQLIQPNTIDSILVACLCSQTLRTLMVETLRLVTETKRFAFFDLLRTAHMDGQPELGTVANWLRFEFSKELAAPRPNALPKATKENRPPIANPVNSRGSQTKGSPHGESPHSRNNGNGTPKVSDNQSSISDIFNWDHDSNPEITSSSSNTNGTETAAQNSNQQKPTNNRQPRASDSPVATNVSDKFDEYASDVMLADSDADIDFFNVMTESFSSDPEINHLTEANDSTFELDFASNGSQTSMSLSGLLAAPEFPRIPPAAMPQRPTMPAFQPNSRMLNTPPPFNLTGSSPLIPAFTNYPLQPAMGGFPMPPMMVGPSMPPSAVNYSTQSIGGHQETATPPALNIAVTTDNSNHQSPIATLTGTIDSHQDEADFATVEKARAEKAKAKSTARLAAARTTAFQAMHKDAEEIPKSLPRLINKKVSKLMMTPSTKIDEIIEQIKHLGATGSPTVLSTISTYCQKPAKVIREACADALGDVPHQGSALLLLKLLADSSGTVAEAAVKSLMKLDQEPTRPVLLAAGLCGSSLRTVISAGVESSTDENKPEWEKYLLEVIRGDDTEATAFAISLLARIAGETHLEIFQRLASDPAPVIRAAAIEALSRTQAKRAISQINNALEDNDATVRAQAAMSVATMYSPRSIELLQKLVFDDNLVVRRNAAQSMSKIDESDLSKTIAKALDQETDATTVEYLLAALQRNGGEGSLPILQRYIEGEGSQFREQATKALRKLKIPASVPIFRRLLDDHTPALRRQSIEQLAVLKSESVLPRLREMLKQDPDETVRSACARALGDFGDSTSLHLLEEALEDHPLVRLQCVIALGRLGQASAGSIMLGLLQDSQPEIRYQAVRALAQLKLEGTEESIQALMNDSDEMVRRGAEQSLQDLGMTTAQIRKKKIYRRVSSIAVRFAPSAFVGVIPGGSKVLLTLIFLVISVGGYFTFGNLRLFATGGEKLRAGRVTAVGISGSTKTAAVLRHRGVLDIWSVAESKLVDRVQAPRSAIGLFCEESGGVLLNSQTYLTRLDPKSDYSEVEAQTIKFDAAPSALYFHQKSNSICAFFAAAGTTKLRVIDASTLKETKTFTISGEFSRSCVVSPDYSLAMMVEPSGNITLCDLKTGEVVHASAKQMTGSDSMGTVYGITFTDDMKYVCFCTEKSFLALTVSGMELVKNLPSPDGYSFIAGQPVPGTSDVVVMSSVGKIYRFSKDFKETTESAIEQTSLSNMFDISAMGTGGDLMIVANSEETGFDVFSSIEEKILIAGLEKP